MWDERYATDEYVYGREPNDFLVEMADRLPRGRALCLGEGEGRNAVFLAQRGFTVTAVDSSGVALTKARRLAAELGVDIETVQADLGDFSLDPGQWDLILSIFCHLPPPLRATVHRRSAAGLRLPAGGLQGRSAGSRHGRAADRRAHDGSGDPAPGAPCAAVYPCARDGA